jgi:hypothetical protein
MEMTCAVPAVKNQMSGSNNMTTTNMTIMGNDDMELTLTQSALKQKFGTRLTNDTLDDNVFVDNDMSMTCAVPAHIRFNRETKDQKVALPKISSGQKRSEIEDNEVFSATGDKTFVAKDDDKEDMEMTCAMPAVKNQKLGSTTTTNMTTMANDDMEMTLTQSALKQKFGTWVTTKDALDNNDFEDNDMSMTCAVPANSGLNRETKVQKISSGPKSSKIDDNKVFSATDNKTFVAKDDDEDNMEMTCAMPSVKNQKLGSKSIPTTNRTIMANDDMALKQKFGTRLTTDTLDDSVFLDNDMSMTCAVPAHIRFNQETKVQKIAPQKISSGQKNSEIDDNEVSSATDNKTFVAKDDDKEDMELTCAMPAVKNQKSGGINMTTTNDDDMELTSTQSAQKLDKMYQETTDLTTGDKTLVAKDTGVSMTVAVPVKNPSLGNSCSNIVIIGNDDKSAATQKLDETNQETTGDKTFVAEDTDVSMTVSVPVKPSSHPGDSLTKTVIAGNNDKSAAGEKLDTKTFVAKDDDKEDMEMTCTMPALIKQKSGGINMTTTNDDMELTSTQSAEKLDKMYPETTDLTTCDKMFVTADTEEVSLTVSVPVSHPGDSRTNTVVAGNNDKSTAGQKLDETNQETTDLTTGDKTFVAEDTDVLMTVSVPVTPSSLGNSRTNSVVIGNDDKSAAVQKLDVTNQETTVDKTFVAEDTDVSMTVSVPVKPSSHPGDSRTNTAAQKLDETYQETTDLSKEEFDSELDKKSRDRKQCLDRLRQYLKDLESPPQLGEPLPKRSKMNEGGQEPEVHVVAAVLKESIFQVLAKKNQSVDKCHHGHWKLISDCETSANFTFYLGTLGLNLVLGHSVLSASNNAAQGGLNCPA